MFLQVMLVHIRELRTFKLEKNRNGKKKKKTLKPALKMFPYALDKNS